MSSETTDSYTWRDFLAHQIPTPADREQLAMTLRINPMTLTRWVRGEATPRLDSLHRLLEAFPEQQRTLLPLLQASFGGLLNTTIREEVGEIPANFYAQIFREVCTIPMRLHSWTIGKRILLHALNQFAPQGEGMMLTLMHCLPPRPGWPVRSLYGGMGVGHAPWRQEWIRTPLLVGSESLSGYALTSGHPVIVPDTRDPYLYLPIREQNTKIHSIAAAPIQREGHSMGCLYACHVQPQAFTSSSQALFQRYAELLSLIFEPGDFYAPSELQLAILPDDEKLQAAFNTFQQRVTALLNQATQQQHSLTIEQAELQSIQQIEQELLQLEPLLDTP